MSDISVEEYKKFIDSLIEISKNPSSAIGRIQKRMNVFSERPDSEQQRKEKIIASLSPEQRDVVIELLFGEREEVIGEILAFFAWKEYRISHDTIPLAIEPFAELSYDFGARLEGREWPDDGLITSLISIY